MSNRLQSSLLVRRRVCRARHAGAFTVEAVEARLLFAGTTALEVVALSGQAAPGAGNFTYNTFENPAINAGGQIAFQSSLRDSERMVAREALIAGPRASIQI